MLIFDIIIGMLIISGISMACLGLYGRRFVNVSLPLSRTRC
jgi:hypothetical protein